MDWHAAIQLTSFCFAVSKALCWKRATGPASDHFNRAFEEDIAFVAVAIGLV